MKLAWPTGSYQSTLAPPIGSSNNDIILQPNMGPVDHMVKGIIWIFMSEVSPRGPFYQFAYLYFTLHQ